MTHDVIRHLLDDYVAGDLNEDVRPEVADHIAGCAICSAEVRSLMSIAAQTAALPRSIEPPPGAWSRIKATIERDSKNASSGRDGVAFDHGYSTGRIAFWQRPRVLAAAAVLIAVLSSGGTILYLGQQGSGDSRAARIAAGGGSGATAANLAAFTVEENSYLRTASILSDLLEQQQGALAPETVAQLKASLRTIDEAILEARNALARDPANTVLVEMLSSSYRQKLDLLRRTTEMTRGS